MIFFRRFVSERQLTNAYWSPHSPSGWRKISPNISKNMASACVIFTRISTPSNVWRLSATCVWVSSTCWWGINLLREGLDMPEVSLVAILDADKEGFLRSERSLIQTIGRAARNVNGKAILYGDKITPINGESDWRNRTSPRETAEVQRGTRHYAARLEQESGRYPGRWGRTLLKPKRRAEENRDRLLSRIMCRWICRLKRCNRKSMSWKG